MAMTIGLAGSSGFGMTQMKPADIKAYSDVFKDDLSIWEAETLLRISGQYISAYHEYDGVDCLPPNIEDVENSREEVAAKLKATFARRSQANKRSPPIGGRNER
jgi:hypothetical protein